jgi:trimeric autotransporter adhesin
LTVGQCTGVVSIIVPGASNTPLNVTVTVNITNPATLTLSSTNVSFNYAVGSTTFPQNQAVQLGTSNSSIVAYTTSTTAASGGNFFSVTPASGNTPQSLTISMNQSALQALGAGTYTGTVTIASSGLANVTIGVTLTVTSPPLPLPTTIVNAATQQPGPISPGEIITIYGTNIGPVSAVSLTLNGNGTVSTNIGNTQVFFDGIAAPLIYVSATQINLIVPYEMAGRTQTTLTVVRGGLTSNALHPGLTDTSPGIFTSDSSGHGPGAILNQNGTFNGPGVGAPKGSVISIYATGEGQISPPGVTGTVTSTNLPIPKPVATPVTLVFVVPGPNGTTVNVPATIQYAGEAPALVSGVLQVNAVVPATVPSGAQTIVLTVGANSSPSVVTVQVQ